MDVGLWDAWGLWSDGADVRAYQLWGQPIVWWGRLGKLAQFLSGLVVVLDLVGPERLRAWAQRASAVAWQRVRQLRLLATAAAWRDFRRQWMRGVHVRGVGPSEQASLYAARQRMRAEFSERYRVGEAAELTVDLVIAVVLVAMIVDDDLAKVVPDHPRLWLFAPLLLVPGFAFYLVSLAGALVRTAVGWLLRPLAWLLDRDHPGHQLRWAAVGLFVAGFHFDLLAS